MQILEVILIAIAALLLIVWLASFVFGVLLHLIGFVLHFAPWIALILIIFVLVRRRSSNY